MMSRAPFVPWLLTLGRNGALDTPRLKSERQCRSEDHTEATPRKLRYPNAKNSSTSGVEAKRFARRLAP